MGEGGRGGAPRRSHWFATVGEQNWEEGNSPNMRKGKEYFVQGEKKSWRIFPQSFLERREISPRSLTMGGWGRRRRCQHTLTHTYSRETGVHGPRAHKTEIILKL